MMGHKYPFTVIHITVPPDFIDVNVHPTKMELRFADNEKMYHIVYDTIRNTLSGKNMIVPVSFSEKEDKKVQQQQLYQRQKTYIPEPFEVRRKEQTVPIVQETISTYQATKPIISETISSATKCDRYDMYDSKEDNVIVKQEPSISIQENKPFVQTKQIENQEQLALPIDLLSKDNKKEFHLIGQLFATYWLIEMEEQLKMAEEMVNKEYYTILLSHRPEWIETYQKYAFDLVLCGHAHGGQWRTPFLLNGLYAPHQGLFPKYAGGRYDYATGTMIVSRGLARESTPVPRIFNRPELVVVELN